MSQWKRIVAVSCSHGDLIHPSARAQVLAFCERFKPHYRVDLGDLIDTACFRGGSAGTRDEAHDPRDDHAKAVQWIEDYRPTHITWGNHDWRLFKLLDHPKGIVRSLAAQMWDELNKAAKRVRAKTAPYHRKHGWFTIGGYHYGHGWEYNEHALRSHANSVGGPVVIGHLHHPHQNNSKTLKYGPSFCAGALANEDLLTYGHERLNSLTHGHGIVLGETNGEESHLWLAQGENGKTIHFPPGI